MAIGYKEGLIKLWLVNDLQKGIEFNKFEYHDGSILDIQFYYKTGNKNKDEESLNSEMGISFSQMTLEE